LTLGQESRHVAEPNLHVTHEGEGQTKSRQQTTHVGCTKPGPIPSSEVLSQISLSSGSFGSHHNSITYLVLQLIMFL